MSEPTQLSYDESLLLLAKQGNLSAQGQLVENYQLQIRTFVASLSGNIHSSDDLTQEVFLRLLARLDKLESAEKILPFLKGIARNVVKEHFKKQKVQQNHQQRWMEICEQIELARLEDHSGNQANKDTDKLESLSICLQKLPAKSRELLELQYNQSMNATEIADHLKLKATAVRKSFSRLRGKLLTCIKQNLSSTT